MSSAAWISLASASAARMDSCSLVFLRHIRHSRPKLPSRKAMTAPTITRRFLPCVSSQTFLPISVFLAATGFSVSCAGAAAEDLLESSPPAFAAECPGVSLSQPAKSITPRQRLTTAETPVKCRMMMRITLSVHEENAKTVLCGIQPKPAKAREVLQQYTQLAGLVIR